MRTGPGLLPGSPWAAAARGRNASITSLRRVGLELPLEGMMRRRPPRRDLPPCSDKSASPTSGEMREGRGATQSARVWITAVAIGPDGRAYALFVESIGGGSAERPYFIMPLGSGHREVLTIEGEDESHEGEAIATWAEQWLGKPK